MIVARDSDPDAVEQWVADIGFEVRRQSCAEEYRQNRFARLDA